MSEKRIIELKGFDGSKISIRTTKTYPIKRWKEAKCWAFFCNNPFYFIHLNRYGMATHAYCYHISGNFPELNKREKWVHIEKGKLITDSEN